jgi:hypothetical protein
MKPPGPPELSVALQLHRLRSNPLAQGSGGARRGRLDWHYQARPTPLSRAYEVQLTYQIETSPRVYVHDPVLVDLADGRWLPHVYQQRPARLCLYLPGAGEWSPRLRLDETVVPWTALWLFFFEEWLATDEWKGGGVHPGDNRARH